MVPETSRLEVRAGEHEALLILAGELDSHTAGVLEPHLTAADPGTDLVLDTAEVRFVDSSGLRVLIEAHHRHSSGGSRLVIARPSTAVAKLLELAGLTGELHVDPSP